jgi:hypothetical protein
VSEVNRNEIDQIEIGAPCVWSNPLSEALRDSEASAYTYCLCYLPSGLEAAIHLSTDRWYFTARYRESGLYASPHSFETRREALDGLKGWLCVMKNPGVRPPPVTILYEGLSARLFRFLRR